MRLKGAKRTLAEQICRPDRKLLKVGASERQAQEFLHKLLSYLPDATVQDERIQIMAEEQYRMFIRLQTRGKKHIRAKLKVLRDEMYVWEGIRSNPARYAHVDTLFKFLDELAMLCEANLISEHPVEGQRPFGLLKELQRCFEKLVTGKHAKRHPRLCTMALRRMRVYMGAESTEGDAFRRKQKKWFVVPQSGKVASWSVVFKKSSRRCKRHLSSLLWTTLGDEDSRAQHEGHMSSAASSSMDVKNMKLASNSKSSKCSAGREGSQTLLGSGNIQRSMEYDTPSSPISLLHIQPSCPPLPSDNGVTNSQEVQLSWDDVGVEEELPKESLFGLDEEVAPESEEPHTPPSSSRHRTLKSAKRAALWPMKVGMPAVLVGARRVWGSSKKERASPVRMSAMQSARSCTPRLMHSLGTKRDESMSSYQLLATHPSHTD